MPSIDRLLTVARLQYLGRVERERPRSLIAALHARPRGQPTPWVAAVRRDVTMLTTFGFFADLPDLDAGAEEWVARMAHKPAWKREVDRVFFTESSCDRVPASAEGAASRALSFHCPSCPCAFASQRALDSHARAKHGIRSPYRERVRSSACPCCCIDFRTRVRLLNHLGDKRRPRCEIRFEALPSLASRHRGRA